MIRKTVLIRYTQNKKKEEIRVVDVSSERIVAAIKKKFENKHRFEQEIFIMDSKPNLTADKIIEGIDTFNISKVVIKPIPLHVVACSNPSFKSVSI